MIDTDALTAGRPDWVISTLTFIAVALLFCLLALVVATRDGALTLVAAAMALCTFLGAFAFLPKGPDPKIREEAQTKAEKVLVEAVKDKYRISEVETSGWRDWGETAVAATLGDFQDAPLIAVLTDDGVTAKYMLLFNNKTGEASLLQPSSDAAPAPPANLAKAH